MIFGQYSPTVLIGRGSSYSSRGTTPRLIQVYELIVAGSEPAEMSFDDQPILIQPGQVAIRRPGVKARYLGKHRILSGNQSVGFIVKSCKLENPAYHGKHGKSRTTLFPIDQEHRELQPESLWGVDIPTVLGQEISQEIVPHISYITNNYWRNEWLHHRANTRLTLLLDTLISHYRLSVKFIPDQEDGLTTEALNAYITDNIQSIASVETIAAAFSMSKGHFSRQFSSLFKESPAQHIRNYRLQLVADYLMNTNLMVSDIAHLVGFKDGKALLKAWQSQHAETPSQWRQRKRTAP